MPNSPNGPFIYGGSHNYGLLLTSLTNATAGVLVTDASGNVNIVSPLPVTSGGTGTVTTFTQGSVLFAGASGVYSQDNANFFWDATNHRLGIKNATPGNPLTVNTPTTADALAQVMIATGSVTNKGLVIQAANSQTANMQEWQNGNGTPICSVGPSGAAAFTAMSTSGTYTNSVSNGGAAPADGYISTSITAATSGTPVQCAKQIHLEGNAWDTGSSSSKQTDWTIASIPISANPVTGSLTLNAQIAGGGYKAVLSLGSGGAATFGVNASLSGKVVIANGGASGTSVTIQNNGATSAYNFNLPATAGSSGQVLTSQGGGSTAMTWSSATFTPTAPVFTSYSSGTGTFSITGSPLYLRVRMVGGGGGGGGGGATAGSGTSGTQSTFGTSLLSSAGGTGAAPGGQGAVGGGSGTTVITSPANGTIFPGNAGGGGDGNITGTLNGLGGFGGASYFGGSPTGGYGGSAVANGTMGAGGAGGGENGATGTTNGSGGGSGDTIDAIITSPSASYSYSVGAGGTGGTAGTSGVAGSNGGTGYIEVMQYYQ